MRATVAPALAGAAVALLAAQAGGALGHGLGIDSGTSAGPGGGGIDVTVEMLSEQGPGPRRATITAQDPGGGPPPEALEVAILHGGREAVRGTFHAPGGSLALELTPADGAPVGGELEAGAWRAPGGGPLEVRGPGLGGPGLYTFEVAPAAPGGGAAGPPARADLTVVEDAAFAQTDSRGAEVAFATRSYFDRVSGLEYDPAAGEASLSMPFDWDPGAASHVPVVHVEVRFPKSLGEFMSPSYTGEVHGVQLFKASVTIDDYTEEDERIVHFVLLGDHVTFLGNQLSAGGEGPPPGMEFLLRTSDEGQFPLTAYTAGEEFRVDLSWEPPEVEPGREADFIFTIRDGATGEPLRRSTYDFVILREGQEAYRASGEAVVGGSFERYEFGEGQTGPVIVRIEDIRGTGAAAEFGLVVVPEFGAVAALVLAAAMAAAVAAAGRLGPPRPL